MSVAQLVAKRVSRLKKGTPFTIENFYSLGSVTSVQKAFSRLAKEGSVERVAKGIYSRPVRIAGLPNITFAAEAEAVARAWAKAHHYKIAPQSLQSAYRLGLQTQAPMKTILWTTGPSREFRVGNQVATVKHTSEAKLRWPERPEGELFRGLLAISESAKHAPVREILTAIKRLKLTPVEASNVLQKVASIPEMTNWRAVLESVSEQQKSHEYF
ncbi:DUF6088 family protein [Shewanella oncorhynchi]|uniref:DUF6088 family protein n=1 Tax=Shewanella oncorhynchi TaxID=2726434 RepID=UPI003D793DC4